jgi:hypothetical protein
MKTLFITAIAVLKITLCNAQSQLTEVKYEIKEV